MTVKELKEGIDIIFYNPYKEERELLLQFLRQLGKRTNSKFRDDKFDNYIKKQEKEL